MKLIYFLVLFLLVSPVVLAGDYYFSAKQQEGKIVVTHFISSEELAAYIIPLPESYSQLSSNVNYTLEGKNLRIYGDKIRLSYLQDNTDTSDSKYYFAFSINSSLSDRLFIDFFSDKGYHFERELIFPKGWTFILGDSGDIASLVSENGKESSFLVVVDKSSSFRLSYVFYFLLAIVILVLVYLFYKRRRKAASFLLESEKKVIDFLKKADRREAWQKKIQEETGFSKAKLSRLIRDLEARGLIEKIPMGNTNKVRMK